MLEGSFTLLDWGVVLGVLVVTTIIGERLSGKQASVRDFFLGGRRLPWFAVAASIVATEISAVTFISLPSVVFKDGGNLKYLQIGLFGSLIARAVVGLVLVPAYYEREIYSPYDYVGQKLGQRVKAVTTAFFTLGGVLGQAARVYMTALVLEILMQQPLHDLQQSTGIPPLVAAVTIIGAVAVAWTWIGGIAAVVWTDGILFLLFVVGIAASLWVIGGQVTGGLGEALRLGWENGKFEFFDFSFDLTQNYTMWTALIGGAWMGIGAYGLDQLMAQRLFCCREPREARKAMLASYAAMLLTVLVGLVGVGLFAYYREFPLDGAAHELIYGEEGKPDRILPVFVVEVLPAGLKGLVLAGAFAAAISSLDSILAALSQTTLSLTGRLSKQASVQDQKRSVLYSRLLVVFWGLVLCAAAVGIERVAGNYDSVLDLALACPVAKLAEEESAALGAALQAAWSVGRAAGEDLHPAELAEPFLRIEGEPREPTPAGVACYAELGQRFRSEVEPLYGVA